VDTVRQPTPRDGVHDVCVPFIVNQKSMCAASIDSRACACVCAWVWNAACQRYVVMYWVIGGQYRFIDEEEQ
jgi:hypothetical protein